MKMVKFGFRDLQGKKAPQGKMSGGSDKADPATTTTKKCKCKSTCRASITDLFRKDWCYTKDRCGKSPLRLFASWDHCKYLDSEKPDYQAKTWREKHDWLWDMITADKNSGPVISAQKVFTESVLTVFENQWDVLPNG